MSSKTSQSNPVNGFAKKQNESPSNLELHYKPLPASKKVYETGTLFDDVRVPFREISQTPTLVNGKETENLPIRVYDTSGPYTDPDAKIDLCQGLPQYRRKWICDQKM